MQYHHQAYISHDCAEEIMPGTNWEYISLKDRGNIAICYRARGSVNKAWLQIDVGS